jgi:O-antigen ligase
MIPRATASDRATGGAPIARTSALSAGFYQLTLVAMLLSVADLRLRPVPVLPSFSLLELVAVPTLFAVVAELMARPRIAVSLGLYRHNRPLVWYIVYAAIASAAGLTRSSDSLQAFHDLFAAFALYVLVVVTVDTRARLIGLLAANLAGALPGLLLGLLQIATGGFYLLPRSENFENKLDLAGDAIRNSPTGLLAHPNGLALYLLPIVLFLLVGAWRGFGDKPRRSLAIGLVLAVSLLVLKMTYAKGVYAWAAAGVLFLVLPRMFDRWRFWIALIIPVAGITALIWLSLDAFLSGDLQYGTIISRLELWFSALDIIQSDRFVLGFGSGGPQLLARGLVSFEYPNPHNAWLSQALTYGAPALVFYLAAFGSAFRSLAHRIRSGDRATRAVALAAMASLMAVFAENFFEPADRGATFQAQLLMLLAVAARAGAAAEPRAR